MKIFTSDQIREIDRFTIENEPVKSVDLMERAAGRLFEWIIMRYPKSRRFFIFIGPGNNGGDGLVLARLLADSGYKTEVNYIRVGSAESSDWKINRERLEKLGSSSFYQLSSPDKFPVLFNDDIIVDAIFGSGLKKSPEGIVASVIKSINSSGCEIIAVDMPTGLPGENMESYNTEAIVRADHTLSFQFPKLAFMFADCYPFTGEWHILPIGLNPEVIQQTKTPFFYTEENDILPLLKQRGKFDHKGTFGHGLLIAGSRNKAGAVVLAARAALRTGAGLVTCHIPSAVCPVLQTALPEAMVLPDNNESVITSISSTDDFSAVGIGPGIGTAEETANALRQLLKNCTKPMVIDADALNIMGMHRDWFSFIRPGTILTPHPKEFERIAGKTSSCYERLMLQISISATYKCIIIVKGANTSVSLPDSKVYFNSTGNPGMATAGSGDVLTGIILSLLAQGYTPGDSAVAGVFIHGMAGDMALRTQSPESVIATDIIENIGNAFMRLRDKIVK